MVPQDNMCDDYDNETLARTGGVLSAIDNYNYHITIHNQMKTDNWFVFGKR